MDHTSRRGFLGGTMGTGLFLGFGQTAFGAGEGVRKAPFKVLFSNDTTNIESCPSAIKKRGEPFTDSNLRASVAETAGKGIDVHLLQPGLGWVPWWQSEVLPMKRHVEWLKSQGGKPENYRAWTVPASSLKAGTNQIELTLVTGKPVSIGYLDLAVR